MRTGTTWIHDYLAMRGDVCLPNGVKETFFFDRRFGKGLRWYESHFRHYKTDTHRLIVEVAPSYFHHAEAPGRVYEMLDGPFVVATLREPVKRSYSHYLHLLRYGYTRLPLRDAVKQFPGIIEASSYAKVLRRWMEYFDEKNLKIIFHDELVANPSNYAGMICKMLNLPFDGLPEGAHQKSNEIASAPNALLAAVGRRAGDVLRGRRLYFLVAWARRMGLRQVFFGKPGKGKLPELGKEDRLWLMEFLLPEIEELERLVNRSLAHWKTGVEI